MEIWKDVLDIGLVGIDESFFEVGGDSLLTVRMFLSVEQSLGRACDASAFFASRRSTPRVSWDSSCAATTLLSTNATRIIRTVIPVQNFDRDAEEDLGNSLRRSLLRHR